MNNNIYVGIDPGLKGGIVVIFPDNTTEQYVMPTILNAGKVIDLKGLHKIVSDIAKLKPAVVIFEDVHAIRGASAGSTFSFGWGVGAVEGVLAANKLSYQKINPKVWQKFVFTGLKEQRDDKGKLKTKEMAYDAVSKLYPHEEIQHKIGKKPHDGVVDAMCMAHYGKTFR